MANKKNSSKKPKQNKQKMSGQKGGSMSASDLGAPMPARKRNKGS